MEGILKVTPEKLIQASNEFSQTGKTISSLTSEMMSIVNGLKSIWQGEAANSYNSRFTSLQDDIDKIMRWPENTSTLKTQAWRPAAHLYRMW